MAFSFLFRLLPCKCVNGVSGLLLLLLLNATDIGVDCTEDASRVNRFINVIEKLWAPCMRVGTKRWNGQSYR